MTRISNTEQVMALVRNQLQRMAKRERDDKTQKTQKADARTLTQRERVVALNAIKGLSEEDFTQNFVRALLTDELGEKVSHSPEFQAIVERTAKTIRADKTVQSLIKQIRGQV
ncbi:hypothetical protein ACRAQ7_14315 [Erythrobacter sp. W53]|uniref:hypothetical protein n=1 Tax=Erythrobacter sp. W53 TaxID=3425947 RepID=UPI003D7685AB